MKKYFIFDCETGGPSPEMSLLTLYGMVLDQNLEPIDSIGLTIKPNNGRYVIRSEAMAVNKIDIVKHDSIAIYEKEAAAQFYNFAFKHGSQEKMTPIGHNLSMDIDFVKVHLLKDRENSTGSSWGKFFSYRRIDTASIAQYLIISGKLPNDLDGSLGSLAKYFKLSYDGAHNAQFDTELTLEVLKKQITLIANVPSILKV